MEITNIIKKWLGISSLEKRISHDEKEIDNLKKITEVETIKNYEKIILKILKKPMSTIEIAKELKISRSYTSQILNRLEKKGKVYEFSKKGRKILYKRK